jgi:hypothetical protein
MIYTSIIRLYALIIILLIFAGNAAAQYEENAAYLVITGMQLNEDPQNYVKDPSLAIDAKVRLINMNGHIDEKTTTVFPKQKDGLTYYTADFKVDLETTYVVEMIFKDGTSIRIDDYKLLKSWKTHFYFHSTDGSLSPASILRSAGKAGTELTLCIFAVYPYANYLELGGNQLISGIDLPKEDAPDLKLYPNPTSGNTQLTFQLKSHDAVQLSILTLSGQQIYADKKQFSSGINTWNLDITDKLLSGVYLVKTRINGVLSTKRLVVYNY